MESLQDRSITAAEEEDRISILPDDIICHILSFIDLKSAIQLSTLAHRWKHIWILIPRLNLNCELFPSIPLFARFVNHALSRRDNHAGLDAVDLTVSIEVNQFVVRSILNYAYSHNVKQLTVTRLIHRVKHIFPQDLFSSRSLKHLTLETDIKSTLWYSISCIPTSAWDFPALETLNLNNIRIGETGEDQIVDIFSKCVNLKDLNLHRISIHCDMEIFNVCSPKLVNLTITHTHSYPNVFNVVAPRLENLTSQVRDTHTRGNLRFPDHSQRLSSLEKVNLSLSRVSYKCEKETYDHDLLNLFSKLGSAKYVILNWPIIETLSSCLDQLSRESCPFDDLKCLKINTPALNPNDPIPEVHPQVKKYLLENSPRATFIMDLPHKVEQKRSREQVDNDSLMAKKVAKLELGKIQKQDQVIS